MERSTARSDNRIANSSPIERLPPEIVEMVLSPLFHISLERLSSSSPAAFGKNDFTSSTYILRISPLWRAIAMKHLYETVVLRSSGQAHAFMLRLLESELEKTRLQGKILEAKVTDAIQHEVSLEFPDLASRVRKIRIESAYEMLDYLKLCTKLETVSINVDLPGDISGKSMQGLRRGLQVITPKRVFLLDFEDYKNKRVAEAFQIIYQTIPTWKRLETFGLPPNFNRPHNARKTEYQRLSKRLLNSSIATTVIHAIPPAYGGIWSFGDLFLLNFDLADHVTIVGIQVNRTAGSSQGLERRIPPTNWQFQGNISEMATICKRIFEFVVDPHEVKSHDYSKARYSRDEYESHMSTLYNLSLVCRHFKEWTLPILYKEPYIRDDSALSKFAGSVSRNVSLAGEVRWLNLACCRKKTLSTKKLLNLFSELFPCLTGLESLWGGYYPVSTNELKVLACSLGRTLKYLSRLVIINKLDEELAEAFSHLVSLADFNAMDFDQSVYKGSNEHPKHFLAFNINLDDYPPLSASFNFHRPARGLLPLLQLCGRRLVNLSLVSPSGLDDENYDIPVMDIFCSCPVLKELYWIYGEYMPHNLFHTSESKTLERLVIKADTKSRSFPKDICIFLEQFNVSPQAFPALREISLPSYSWPTRRDKERNNRVFNKIQEFNQRANGAIVVSGADGKPWRKRTE